MCRIGDIHGLKDMFKVASTNKQLLRALKHEANLPRVMDMAQRYTDDKLQAGADNTARKQAANDERHAREMAD